MKGVRTVASFAIADKFFVIGIPGCPIRVFRVTLRTFPPEGHVVCVKAAVYGLRVFAETHKLPLAIIVVISGRMPGMIRIACG
jgi:hypothetical protein